MSLRSKILATAASLTLLGGTVAAGALTASASTTGCAFTNGCATLHGTDASGNTVAMDAKYKNDREIVIGYPDIPGDGATSYDGVLHYGRGTKTTTYADTGFTLSPTFTSVPCLLTTDLKVTPTAAIPTTAGGNTLTVNSTTGTVTYSPPSGASIVLGGTGTAVIDEEYASDGVSCQAAYSGPVTAGSFAAVAPDTASLVFPTSPGGSTWTFLDEDSGGAFTFTGLPAGVSVSGGSLTADTSTAHPGTYTNVGVSYTAKDGAVFTATFTLVISGIKTTTPGAGVPFYTFVYAANGVWSNQCVTDINGSGALRMATCTLGHDTGQDFTIGAATPGLLSGSQAPVRNLLAEAVNPADSYLVDPSTSDPSARQTDAADELPPGGRQMYVNGTDANLWSWGT